MKKRNIALSLVISMSLLLGLFAKMPGNHSPVSNAQAAANLPVGQTGTNWAQTFADEFDGTSLNRNVWRSDLPNGGNGELQEYVDDNSHNNYIVQNGMLQIVARKESYMGRNYTSGIIYSQYSFRQKYGYFEMRAQVPSGKGLWPAFWMLADPWVPEIDVTEILAGQPNVTYMTLHYHNSSGGTSQTMSSYTGPDFSAGWHVFGVDWEPNALVWYVDGVERKRVTDTSIIPSDSMWILANLAVGGNWPGNPDSTTVFPAYMNIDYIRVWQKTSGPTATPISPTSTTIPASPTPTKVPASPTPTTVPGSPTPTTPPSNSQNMIANASFENVGASPWYAPWGSRNDLGATFTQDTSTAANGTHSSLKASLSSSNSSQPWVVGLNQLDKPLTSGKSYTLSFWAKASATRPIHAVVQEENSPFTEITNQIANLTGSWTKYAFSFTPSVTTATAMVNFNLADAAGSVWLDEVSLCPTGSNCGSTTPPSSTATPTVIPTATSMPTATPTKVSPTATSTVIPTTVAPTATATFPPSDTTPPVVTITYPVNGAQVKRGSTVVISAAASDNAGIAKVEFRLNGNLKCTVTAAPYTCNWYIPKSLGATYRVEAKAYDLSQNTAVSQITVTSIK